MNHLVEAVKRHAHENYEQGWHWIVECYSDAELVTLIGKARTVAGAIKKVGEEVRIMKERESNCRW